jgi:hypothetical protein
VLRSKWNALQIGDLVQVHDNQPFGFALTAGTVAMIDTKRGERAARGIGVRVRDVEGDRVVWPSYLAVHAVPKVDDEYCCRCDVPLNAAVVSR